jgi:hypothetical protein
MFIEKLNKSDIEEFENRKINSFFLTNNNHDIYYSFISNNDWSINRRYNEFEYDSRWLKFMYKKFGKQYKDQFIKHCERIFE